MTVTAQVYEVDPLECPCCHSPMNVIAAITELEEVKKILRHLVKVGRSPPGLDPNFVQSPICIPACSGGVACPRSSSCLLPEAGFLSKHKVPERNHSDARWDLVPKAEASLCNVPDRRENYGF
jgi:hypothetical protein